MRLDTIQSGLNIYRIEDVADEDVIEFLAQVDVFGIGTNELEFWVVFSGDGNQAFANLRAHPERFRGFLANGIFP